MDTNYLRRGPFINLQTLRKMGEKLSGEPKTCQKVKENCDAASC